MVDEILSDQRYRSRRFLLALASFLVVSFMAVWAVVLYADSPSGAAAVIGAWGSVDATILGLYNYSNVRGKEVGS